MPNGSSESGPSGSVRSSSRPIATFNFCDLNWILKGWMHKMAFWHPKCWGKDEFTKMAFFIYKRAKCCATLGLSAWAEMRWLWRLWHVVTLLLCIACCVLRVLCLLTNTLTFATFFFEYITGPRSSLDLTQIASSCKPIQLKSSTMHRIATITIDVLSRWALSACVCILFY